jgi:squalene-associated FAD-dependent desaturase
MSAPVVVIGAGWAGLAAAVRLSDAGVAVTVVEESPRLGGRATAFVDRESGERVDNGQHVLFGCYRETYAFLRRIGTAGLAPLQPRLDLTMVGPQGQRARLRCPRLPAPWHLVAGVLRWGAVPARDRRTALRLRHVIRDVRRDGAAAVAARVSARSTVDDWLREHGQSATLSEWLWRPLALAALNQSPATASAAPFVRVLGELFSSDPASAAVGLPAVPLDELCGAPAKAFIEARGGAVHQRAAARIDLDDRGSIAAVYAGHTRFEGTRVVSAVPWFAFGRLFARGAPPALAHVAERAAATPSSPIVTVNLWLDGPVLEPGERFVGLVRGPAQWVFDKRALWDDRAGHVAVVVSGADEIVRMDNAGATETVMRQLRRVLPRLAHRQLLRSVVVREHRATFSLAPDAPARPGPCTDLTGFYLAGDWTDTGLPGTIESAVVSGHRAAEAVLRDMRRATTTRTP